MAKTKVRVLSDRKIGFKAYGWTHGKVDYRLYKFAGDRDYALFTSKGMKTMYRGRLTPSHATKLVEKVREKKPVILKVRTR